MRLAVVGGLTVALLASSAQAHWCDDLWGSSYNVVVKPAADSVVVPSGGSATLDVFVQNNTGMPLKNFALRSTAGAGYTIAVSRQSPKVTGFLMPGENLRHTLTITASGGGTLSVQSINFYVDFGDGSQDWLYGGGTTGGQHAVMRKNDGTLRPASPISIPAAGMQALHLGSSAKADYQNLGAGLDELLGEFCAGRGSWDTNGAAPDTTYCSGTATTCPARTTRTHTKYDYQHLWASFELAFRKASLSARTAPLRARLICAANDSHPAFHFFPIELLGYLGDDPGARSYLTNLIATGSADDQAAAKAALLLFGVAADRTAYHADVVAALASANDYVSCNAATTLGIIDADDAAVEARLIPRAGWVEPDTSDDGLNFYAAHLLNLVAWNRRGWATDASYTGSVSFYGTTVDTTAPRPPAQVSCTALSNGTVRVTWSAVTLDVAGGPETIQTYRVYSGTTARPALATRPGEQSFDYDHVDPTTGLFFNFSALDGTVQHYFTVTAVDAANNASVYSLEVPCTPHYTPVAAITCTPTSGAAPLNVTCDSSTSTDPNGTSDIVTRAWRLDGAAQPNGLTFTTSFATAGSHTVQLTVTDAAGLTSTANATVVATSGSNTPPTARAAATPVSGSVPLAVSFSSAGTSDPDASQTLSYSWNFGDGSAASTQANPSHTFNAVGTYDVMLTVTDDGTPPASGTAIVRVTGTGNSPPEVFAATAVPPSGNAPLPVHFSAANVTDPDGNQMTFTWSYGDGSADETGVDRDHTYTTAGTYTARLSATDNGQPPLASPATADFTITVRPPGTQNTAPDCTAAKVTPTTGTVPLTVTLDATGCVDADGDALSFIWRVPRSITTEDTYTTAKTEVVITTPGLTEVKLHARDSNANPLEIDLTFPVNATEGALGPALGSCGCTSGGVESFAVIGLLGLLRLRRRARTPR